jgi:hypothetical protein
VRADDQLALRVLAPSGVEQHAQIGIDIEQSDLSGSRRWAVGVNLPPPRAMSAALARSTGRAEVR